MTKSHASTKRTVYAPRIDLTTFLDLLLTYPIRLVLLILSAIIIKYPTWYVPRMLVAKDPSEHSHMFKDSVFSFTYLITALDYFLICFIRLIIVFVD